jgi:hypothetical protein
MKGIKDVDLWRHRLELIDSIRKIYYFILRKHKGSYTLTQQETLNDNIETTSNHFENNISIDFNNSIETVRKIKNKLLNNIFPVKDKSVFDIDWHKDEITNGYGDIEQTQNDESNTIKIGEPFNFRHLNYEQMNVNQNRNRFNGLSY